MMGIVNRFGYDIPQIYSLKLNKKNLIGTFFIDYRNFIGPCGRNLFGKK
ncbi:MAG: hypothetical protein RL432_1638 [Bacteroidota bacterium]|jgi:hypothetical protein